MEANIDLGKNVCHLFVGTLTYSECHKDETQKLPKRLKTSETRFYHINHIISYTFSCSTDKNFVYQCIRLCLRFLIILLGLVDIGIE